MASFNPHLEGKGAAVLLPSRKAQCDEIFALIDTDKSGTVSLKEMKAMIRLVRPDLKDEDVSKQFHDLDKSKDGRIQADEFAKHYLEQFKGDSEKQFYERMQITKKFLTRKPRLADVFETFDTDHSGTLTKGEMFRMIKLSKPKFTNEDLNALFTKMDTNQDHKISRDEFIMYYFTLFFNETEAEFNERVEEAFQGRRKVKLQLLFNMYDLDGNGYLDLNEFALMLRLNGRKFVSADTVLDTLIKVDKDHNRRVDFSEWMDYMGTLCAQMDDKFFNKAVNSMIAAASKGKDEAKKKMQEKVVAASAAAAAAAGGPAVGSKPISAPEVHVKGQHGHGHGHKHHAPPSPKGGPAPAPAAPPAVAPAAAPADADAAAKK